MHIVMRCISRWKKELKSLASKNAVPLEPFTNDDIYYALFLGLISFIPAGLVLKFSSHDTLKAFALFFSTPIYFLVTGLLMSFFVFVGALFNKTDIEFPKAISITLRVMSIHPFLSFILFIPYGSVLNLLLYGFLVSSTTHKMLNVPLRNAMLFFGALYLALAFLQLRGI